MTLIRDLGAEVFAAVSKVFERDNRLSRESIEQELQDKMTDEKWEIIRKLAERDGIDIKD